MLLVCVPTYEVTRKDESKVTSNIGGHCHAGNIYFEKPSRSMDGCLIKVIIVHTCMPMEGAFTLSEAKEPPTNFAGIRSGFRSTSLFADDTKICPSRL